MVKTDSDISPLNGGQSCPTQDALLPAQFTEFVRQTCDEFIALRSGQGFLREHNLIGGSAQIGNYPIFTMLYCKKPDNGHSPPTQANIRLSGYRTAQHLLQLAHKFHRPLVVFTTSPFSLQDACITEPHDVQGISNLVLSQCRLEAPIVLVVLSRWNSVDIFGIWLVDKMLALEDSRFLMSTRDQETTVPVQLEAPYLVRQGLLDHTVPACLSGPYDAQLTMPQPKQLRAALEEMLEDVLRAPSEELMTRRSQRLERITAMATRTLGIGKRTRVPSLNGFIASI